LAEDAAKTDAKYTQQENVVYAETDGIGLVMDIFRPTGKSNGLGIVDIASGAWHSDRGKINDHKRAQIFDIMCGRGYTVFAVRPGSQTKFSFPEMVDHVKTAIRWVKARHEEFGIDPARLGLCGASAGGHLTCLTATTADDGNPDSKDAQERESSRVAACVAFFPPTDFMNFPLMKVNLDPAKGPVGGMLGKLLFADGIKDRTKEEIIEQVKKISPVNNCTSQCPPFLFIHGDADPIVPLQQSEVMIEALKKVGVSAELIVKKGGGHPWPTINEEVVVATDWFDRQLKPHGVAAAGN